MPLSFKKLFIIFGLIGVFLIGLSFFTPNSTNTTQNPSNPQVISAKSDGSNESIENNTPTDVFRVTRVIDGDTIEVEDGQKVRLIGIDTPETVDPRQPIACFGKESSDEAKRLLEGRSVNLEKDISETDKYGRLLRYVFVDDLFVNDYLVRQGFALVSTFPPDVKYQDQFLQSQTEARENNRGLWSVCQSENLQPFEEESIAGESDKRCLIKGNISSNGEKIYHLPGQRYYSKTQIDEPKGEKWFCTQEDAISGGWRKSKI